MFFLKKLLTSLLTPPGLFISLLLLLYFFKRKKNIHLIFLAAIVYLLSIEPVADFFLKRLEGTYTIPSVSQIKSCDAYVVLGSGLKEGMETFYGSSQVVDEGCQRLLGAFFAYKVERKPIIISGGASFKRLPEAHTAKNFLVSLGIRTEDIIPEEKSRDTYENAIETKKIAQIFGFKKILLITSAYHMKRSNLIFSKYFEVVPLPVGYKCSKRSYDFLSFLPNAHDMTGVAIAIKEYLGIIHFKLSNP